MENKRILIISIIGIIIIGIIILLLYISKPNQITPLTQTPITNSEVTISTDKNTYNQGEVISITVNNGLGENILYNSGGDRFWGIEYYEAGEWKKFGYEDRQGFQLADDNIGDDCYIALYELSYPIELQTQSSLKSQWNQKICPFGSKGPDKPRIIQFIEPGKYRFTFSYGFEMYENDPFRILKPNTVYSDTITIK
jgi:hypothetical protein